MNKNLIVKIIEQPGKLGKLKASQLARLIATYAAESHPEIDEAVKKKQEEETNAAK